MTTGTPIVTRQFWRKLVIDLAVMVAIGVVLALIGPFGSFEASFPTRLAYWVGLGLAGYACYRPMGWAVQRIGAGLDLPVWLLWAFACLIATVPMTLVVAGLDRLPYGRPLPGFDSLTTTYGYVLVVGAIVTLVFFLIERASVPPASNAEPGVPAAPFSAPLPATQPPTTQPPTTQPPASPSPTTQPRLLDRLPPHLGTDLIALEMEDHYVRAHTVLGSELILLRLRDAMAELDGIDGQQVHRSWWVARHAVDDVRRDGRNVRLVLPGGLEAPVARANIAVLKQQGWI